MNVGPADRLDLTRAGEYGRAAPALEAILNLRAAVRDQGVNSVKTSTRATEVARTLRGGLGLMGFLVGLLAWGGTVLGADDPAGVAGGLVAQLGDQLPVWSVLPFVALLGCIALLPLFHGHWWEHNKNKAIISAGLSVPVILVLAAGIIGTAEESLIMFGRTSAGPENAAMLVGRYAYDIAFYLGDMRWGYAAALNLTMGVISMLMAGVIFKLMRSERAD